MANLRADNLTGTGGRNAIDGSLYFPENEYLKVTTTSDLALGSGDFTIETWVNFTKIDTYQCIIDFRGAGNGAFPFIVRDTDGDLYYYVNSGVLINNVPARENGCWHHIAVVRNSGTTKFYLNGVEEGSASDSTTYLASNDPTIGSSTSSSNDLFGYLSNLRIVKGTAVYTSAFTPPTEKLTAIEGTVLLCCQDYDDATQEATGKTITPYGGFGQDKTEGNLLTNTLDWDGAASSYSTTMPHGWTAGNGAQVLYETGGTSGGSANRMLRLRNDGSNSYIYQTISTVIGQKYSIDLWYEAQNSSLAVRWNAGTSAADATDGYSQWTVGSDGNQDTRSSTFIASSTTTYITFQIMSGTDDASVFVDDIQVRVVNSKAPKVLPPVGVDEGVTFEGDTKINSQGVMYFPTGDTLQRSRGRAVFLGGGDPATTVISYTNIQSG